MAKKEIPVYLFTGFLEAGKTTLLQETLEDPAFNAGERTLVILCEEGIEEPDLSTYPGKEVFIERVDKEEDLTSAALAAMERKHRMERVMVEYNGMWMLDSLYRALPSHWAVYQEVMLADASTFMTYNDNMRQQTYDKLSSADPVIFNRMTPGADVMPFHKIVRAASRNCGIIYEYTDKTIKTDEIVDPLPFDINAPVITVADDDFAYLFRDMSENLSAYDGKTISFKGLVAKDKGFPKGMFALGRMLMLCCAADTSYRAFAVECKDNTPFSTGMWISAVGKISLKACPLYQGRGPVLTLLSWEPATPPTNPVATF